MNIVATYQHYRWRSYLKDCADDGKSQWQGLKRDDSWQKPDSANDPELAFWLDAAGPVDGQQS